MKIGKKNLIFPDEIVFDGQRLLDVHDHVGTLKNIPGSRNDFGSGVVIGGIVKAASYTGVLFDEQGMTVVIHDLNPGRRHGHTVLFGFDLFQDAYDHLNLLLKLRTVKRMVNRSKMR